MRNTLYAIINASALLGSLAQMQSLSAISTDPWINEIHYDNSGTDVGEFVEIAGEAGTDLAGYSLILYNGSNGTVYSTINLNGTIPDDSNGFGVLNAISFPTNGLQNGSPDGLALFDPSDALIQFLSYEGSLTATNGPANGLISTDIGVSESGATPIGYSLQLTGVGSNYSDFTWSSPAPASAGSINVGQTFPGKSVPDSGSSAWMLILGLSGLALIKRSKRQYF